MYAEDGIGNGCKNHIDDSYPIVSKNEKIIIPDPDTGSRKLEQ